MPATATLMVEVNRPLVTFCFGNYYRAEAEIAQLAEHGTCNAKVVGSMPILGSNFGLLDLKAETRP